MAQFINDLDDTPSAGKTYPPSGKFVNDLEETVPAAGNLSIIDRVKSFFGSSPKTMTVNPESVKREDVEPQYRGMYDLEQQEKSQQPVTAPRQMTINPVVEEQTGPLTKARKIIETQLSSINDELTQLRSNIDTRKPPEVITLQENFLKSTAERLKELEGSAIDKKLPRNKYEEYTSLIGQYNQTLNKYKEDTAKYNTESKELYSTYNKKLTDYFGLAGREKQEAISTYKPETGVTSSVKGFFQKQDLSKEDKAKYANITALGEQTGLPLHFIEQNYDQVTKELGIRGVPTTQEVIGGLMTAAIGAGLITNPVATLVGLASYMGVKEAESLGVQAIKGEDIKPLQNREFKEFAGELSPVWDAVTDIGEFAVGGVGPAGLIKLKGSNWFRRLTIKERQITAEAIKGINNDINEGKVDIAEIRRKWRDPKNREELLKKYAGKVDKEESVEPTFVDDLGSEKETDIIKEEVSNAAIEGEKPKSDISEHPGTGGVGEKAETGRSDSFGQGGKIKKDAAAEVREHRPIEEILKDFDEATGEEPAPIKVSKKEVAAIPDSELYNINTAEDVDRLISVKSKQYGSKNKYLESDEYKKAYPVIKAIHDKDKTTYIEEGQRALEAEGLDHGDYVEYSGEDIIPGQIEVAKGTLISTGKKAPYVKLDTPVETEKGKKRTIPWNRSWKKIGRPDINYDLTEDLAESGLEKDEIDYVLGDMVNQLQSGEGGGLKGIDEATGENLYGKSTYPQWYRSLREQYAKKKDYIYPDGLNLSADEVIIAIQKAQTGKPLTGKQNMIYRDVLKTVKSETSPNGLYGHDIECFRKVTKGEIDETRAALTSEGLDAGTISANQEQIKNDIFEEVRTEGLVDEETAYKELTDFFDNVSKATEETPTKKETPKGEFKNADLDTVTKSAKITPVTTPKGTANIPVKTTPQAEAGLIEEAKKHKTAEEFVKNHINSETEKWQEIINDTVDNLNYENNEVYAIRGDDYVPKKQFRNSFNRPDGVKGKRIDGISAIQVAENAAGGDNTIYLEDVADAINKARGYGKNVFLIKGERTPTIGNDEWNREVILKNTKIIGIIKNEVDLTDIWNKAHELPNPSRPPEVGGQTVKLPAEEVKSKQSEIPGASERETFNLVNPETEISKPLSEQVTPKNVDLFADENKPKISTVNGVNIIEVPKNSKIGRGVYVASQLETLSTSDLYDSDVVSIEEAKKIGKDYYDNLSQNPINSPAFSMEPIGFREKGWQHIIGEHQFERGLTDENIKRRVKMLPKVKTILESTPFVDEIREKDNNKRKEYGLLGRFEDGTVVRVVIEEEEKNGKAFLTVYDWEDVSKKLKRNTLPESSLSNTVSHGVGKAPSDRVKNNISPPNESVNTSDLGEELRPLLRDVIEDQSATLQATRDGMPFTAKLLGDVSKGQSLLDTIDYLLKIKVKPQPPVKSSDLINSDTASGESLLKSMPTDVKFIRNIIGSDVFLKHGFGGLNVKAKRFMLSHVNRLRSNQKIVDTVIQLIPVDVVNNLVAAKLSPEMLLHDPAMFKAAITGDLSKDIALVGNVSDTLINSFALAGAIENSGLAVPDLIRPAKDGSATNKTFDLDHAVTSLINRNYNARHLRESQENTIKTRATDKGIALYSLRNNNIQTEAENFSRQLDDYATGKLRKDVPLTVGSTPYILERLGAKQLPIIIDQKIIRKILEEKHGIPVETVKQITNQLHDPVMVFDSATQANSLVVMTELQHEGKTIVAAIYLESEKAHHVVNEITTIHPRSNDHHFMNWIENGLLRYMNKKKSREWFLTRGVQFPKVETAIRDFKNKILFDYDLVKGKESKFDRTSKGDIITEKGDQNEGRQEVNERERPSTSDKGGFGERQGDLSIVQKEHERQVGIERQMFSEALDVPDDFREACEKGQGIIYDPDGYNTSEYKDVETLLSGYDLTVIPVKTSITIFNAYIRDKNVFLNTDFNDPEVTPKQAAFHELSHYLKNNPLNKRTRQSIDINSQTFKKYRSALSQIFDKNAFDRGYRLNIPETLEEYAADLEAGINNHYGINLLDGLKKGQRIFTIKEILKSKNKEGDIPARAPPSKKPLFSWRNIETLTEKQLEARKRLEKDVEVLSDKARDAGKSFPDYLKSLGMDDARINKFVEYVKSQPVEYPGYREVQPGETLPLGSEVKMDMASGKSFVKEQRKTGIKNAVTLEEREAKNLSEVELTVKRNFGTAFDEGKRLVDSGERDPRILAEEMAKNPRPLSAEESVMLIYDRMRLQNDHQVVMDRIEASIDKGDAAAELEYRLKLAKIEDDINTNDEAARRTGYEQGLGLAARRMMIQEDYSLARNLQRARIANSGKELPAELRAKYEKLTKQLEEANKKLKEYEENTSKRAAEKSIQKIKNEDAIRKHLIKVRERKVYAKKELDVEFGSLVKNLNRSLSSLHFVFDPDSVKILAQMARNRVMAGVNSVDGIVGEIHDQLKDEYPDITKRDIRDAISGYGKTAQLSKEEIEVQLREIRRQARLVSAYEDALAGQVPLRTGLQREPASDKVRELGRQVKQAMRESGIDSASIKTPEEQWKTSLDAVKTRLINSIIDLSKQLDTGEKTPKKIGIKYDDEANELKSFRDGLKKIVEDIEGKPQTSPEQRIKIATAAVEKSIAEYERRIKEKDFAPQKKTSTTPETPNLKALREKRDHLKEIYKDLQDEAKPKKTPEEIALQAFKTRSKKRIAELENKLATQDYEKKPRRKRELDPEAMALEANVGRLKNLIDEDIRRIKLANRTKLEKSLDYLVKWRRFVILSSIRTVGKLTAAASTRQIITPIEELIGGILSRIPGVSKIASKAPREGGGLNVRAEAKAFGQWFNKQTYRDIRDVAMTGKGQLDILYGDRHDMPPEMLDLFGHLHGALKVTPKRAEFFRSLEKRTQWAIKNGLDITEPSVQATLTAGAYVDANRAIFMNKNVINDAYTMLLRYVDSKGTAGRVAATGMRVMLPIVRVPTNFAIETANYAFGAPKGSAQLIYTLIKKDALKDLKPDEADNIMRSLKKGMIGLAILAIGYYMADYIGGYYQYGEKRKGTDLKPGDLEIYGIKIPHFLLHTPAIEILQMGATIRRVQDRYAGQLKGDGTVAGIVAGAKGIGERIPFLEQPSRMGKALTNVDTASKFTAELGRSLVVPPDVSNIATLMDKENGEPILRKPETAVDVFKMGIPGLREQVPRNTKKEKAVLKDKLIKSLRDDDPDAKINLSAALEEGSITKKEKLAIEKAAEEDSFIVNVKHLPLAELAKRIEKNATLEQKKTLYKTFKNKFDRERKNLNEETKQKYYELMDEMR